MAQSEECLELISVGSLYAGGPWEKKYWSCSRGKERYPYPVGYHARRAHCQLEIREGPQGPLFVITREDGESYTGQTPEIAWRKFNRKGVAPPSKVLHRKRLSCKPTDGIEFFGFKNPFVQRLLRELLATRNSEADANESTRIRNSDADANESTRSRNGEASANESTRSRNGEAVFGGLVTESHQDDEAVGTCNSYSGSEKSDFESVGQDIVKSMMSLVLPQAIPLLEEETSRKKRKKLPRLVQNQGGSPKSVEAPRRPIPDSFGDQCSDVNRQDTRHCCNNDFYPPCIKEDGDLDEADVSHERDGSKDIYCVDEAKPALVEQHPPPEDRAIEHKDPGNIRGPPEAQFCNTKPLGRADPAANSGVLPNRNVTLNNELNGYYELVGCYFHPLKVSSLLLTTDGTHIFICALCGVSNESLRTLFLCKLALEKPRIGVPSFVGQTTINLPSCKDALGRIAHERCCLQLTPDGLAVAMLGSIRAPCCREQRTDCLCQICTSDGFDCSSVKIVQVKCGYVSNLIKLTTVKNPRCLLVCRPNHLAVAGEGGGLHVWAMNLAWSGVIEEFCIPADYERCYSTVELKEIPKSGSLVVGHNGVGEFLVWDISRRILLSRFSAPTTWISEFSAIGVFSLSREVLGFSYLVEDKVEQILEATRLQLSDQCENSSFHKEDPAIWLLVSTASCVDDVNISNVSQRHHQWRLALLAKSMLIFGDELDPRAAAIGASGCHGLIGTSDGLVYAWNLLSGSQLGTLHHFKGGSVSCIATESGVLAVADATGQLMVYQNSQPRAY